MFAQQSLHPKLSSRRYNSVLYAQQNNTVFRRAQTESVSVMDHEQTNLWVSLYVVVKGELSKP